MGLFIKIKVVENLSVSAPETAGDRNWPRGGKLPTSN